MHNYFGSFNCCGGGWCINEIAYKSCETKIAFTKMESKRITEVGKRDKLRFASNI